MDDQFLKDAWREPRPEFTDELRERLREQGSSEAPVHSRSLWRRAPVIAATAALAASAAIAVFPSVRASAEAFLDLFRVRNFVAIQFDSSRLEKLRSLDQGGSLMVLDHADSMKNAGPPQMFTSVDEAGRAAGIDIRQPSHVPSGFALDTIYVDHESVGSVTINGAKLRALLDQLDLKDVEIPPGLDGQTITIRKPPIVVETYRRGGARLGLIQARSPEVALPPGTDLERLGEIGLRVLGLSSGEARKIAESIDWHSTLVVPVPINASSFRRVTVNGHPGLLVACESGFGPPHAERKTGGNMLLWSDDDRVYGLVSGISGPELIEVAESVR